MARRAQALALARAGRGRCYARFLPVPVPGQENRSIGAERMTQIAFPHRFPVLAAGLRAAYGEPHRAYHNWTHVEAMLGHFARLRARAAVPEAVELAIYYHDAVCDPLSLRNEANSARRMCRELAGLVDAGVLARARHLVLATAVHRVPRRGPADLRADCALFLDIDLAILGVAPADFDAYEQAIRREYRAVPERVYRLVRKGIFRRFLLRPAIYHTRDFRLTHERPARDNLVRAVAAL